MDFSEREITDLAAFFAKRFPSYEQRAALSEAAGLAGEAQLTGDARSVWTDVIRVAVRDGRLNELVERAMQQRPDDDNLREMAAVIGAGKRWRARRWGALAAVGVVGLLGALVILQLGGDETELPTDTHGDGLAMVDVEQEPVAEAEPGPVAEPEPEPVAEPEPEPVAEPEPEAREDDARQPLSSKPRDDADHQGDSPPRPAREPQAAPSPSPPPAPHPCAVKGPRARSSATGTPARPPRAPRAPATPSTVASTCAPTTRTCTTTSTPGRTWSAPWGTAGG
jgi:hypothetical protein